MNRTVRLDEANLRFAKVKAGSPAEAKSTEMEECGRYPVTRNPAGMGRLLKSVLK